MPRLSGRSVAQQPPRQMPHINDYEAHDEQVHGPIEARPQLLELGAQPQLAEQNAEQGDE